MAEPILLEIQQRGQEILDYLSCQTPTAASNVNPNDSEPPPSQRLPQFQNLAPKFPAPSST
jgi:hypothetical protein